MKFDFKFIGAMCTFLKCNTYLIRHFFLNIIGSLNDEDPHYGLDKHHKNHVSKSGHRLSRPKVLDKRSLQHRRNLTHWCQRTVDAFELLAQIGEGTYGQVYKARDVSKSES